MTFRESTEDYENWLRTLTSVVESDLGAKHKKMRESPFTFLRATYYRWSERFPALLPELMKTPCAVSVGDAHVENFGVWIDGEGRRVWGANDFDEADRLPVANDLVRLATSMRLACREERLAATPKDLIDAMLEGYRGAFDSTPRPFLIDAEHDALRREADRAFRADYWDRYLTKATRLDDAPLIVDHRSQMPEDVEDLRWYRVRRGAGSLGRPRFALIGSWRRGPIGREFKAWIPAATRRDGDFIDAAALAVRSPDPIVGVAGGWMIQRLSPWTLKIELAELDSERDELKLSRAMGAELANVHRPSLDGSPGLHRDDVLAGSATMESDVIADFRSLGA